MAMPASSTPTTAPRKRVPAAERRDAIIEAAVSEFARGGLHGTPVDRIARRVGVAQPYVFSLFGNKRDLFLAAVERGFARTAETLERAGREYLAGRGPEGAEDIFKAMGAAYVELLETRRDVLMLQHQAYAACDDEVVRARVRGLYAGIVGLVQDLSGGDDERIDDFLRHGMWLNVAAAMGVEDLSAGCEWMRSYR